MPATMISRAIAAMCVSGVALLLGCSGDTSGPPSPPVTPPVVTPPVTPPVMPPVAPPGTPRLIASGPTLVAGTAVTCAVGSDGATYCWGAGRYGTLGDPGARTDSSMPVRVLAARPHLALALNTPNGTQGPWIACGLAGTGEAECWGSSPDGLLGPGTACSAAHGSDQQTATCVYTPTAVAPELRFRRLAVGAAHLCGITADSSVVCWGRNREGQLGTGVASAAATTTPALVAGGPRLVEIAAGQHTTCGVDAAGGGWCWGANGAGQLGDGTRIDRPVPTRVSLPSALRTIEPGHATACGLARDAAVFCWGSALDRRVGIDSAFPAGVALVPVRVPLPVPTSQLRYAGATGCALGVDGVARCWGLNANNSLGPLTSPGCVLAGNGLQAFCLPIAQITLPLVHIGSGVLHTCARARTGAFHCWGDNLWGQAGYPRSTEPGTPQRVPVP